MAETQKSSGTGTNRSGKRDDELAAAREAVTSAYDNLMEAKSHFRHAVEAAGLDATEEARIKADAGREKLGRIEENLGRSVREQPLRSLGMAALVGFILARVVSR